MNANDVILNVVAALDQLGIPYMLADSFASGIYGVPRATLDQIVVVRPVDDSISALLRLLDAEFELGERARCDEITPPSCHVAFHRHSGFMIELFLLSPDRHDQLRFSRRRQAAFAGRSIFLPTPEDVIITKLRWSEGGNRRKDVDDVENIIAVQTAANLDLDYIRHWCDQHGTRELLERILVAAAED